MEEGEPEIIESKIETKEPESESSESEIEQKEPELNPIPQRIIKHLVISGGSIWGIYAHGVIHQCIKRGLLDMTDVQSIYATSVGSMVAIMIALKLGFEMTERYLIDRPWHNVWKIDPFGLADAYLNRGIFNIKFGLKVFECCFDILGLTQIFPKFNWSNSRYLKNLVNHG